MRPLLRLVLKQERQRARQAKDALKVELIDQALQSEDILELLEVATQAEYDYEHPKTGAAGGFGDLVAGLLKFLIDHRTEILALIQVIVQLLAVAEEPPK